MPLFLLRRSPPEHDSNLILMTTIQTMIISVLILCLLNDRFIEQCQDKIPSFGNYVNLNSSQCLKKQSSMVEKPILFQTLSSFKQSKAKY